MELKELQQECHQMARDKGFWDKDRNVGELLMLAVSELAEALEAHRKSRVAAPCKMPVFDESVSEFDEERIFKVEFDKHIKGSFEEEVADTMIRLLDLAGGLSIDLEYYISLKMKYNSYRERLHGKAY